MYYLDSVIFSDNYRNGTVGKKALFTTHNDPTKFDSRTFIWTGDLFTLNAPEGWMVLVNMLSLQAPCLCTKKFNTVGPFMTHAGETTGYQHKKVPSSYEWM